MKRAKPKCPPHRWAELLILEGVSPVRICRHCRLWQARVGKRWSKMRKPSPGVRAPRSPERRT